MGSKSGTFRGKGGEGPVLWPGMDAGGWLASGEWLLPDHSHGAFETGHR